MHTCTHQTHARARRPLPQEDEALEALRLVAAALSTARLRSLDLSDNALGEKGLRAAADALRSPGLGALALQNVGCSVHACAALQELLPAGACSLARLALFNNMSGDEGAGHIAALLGRCPGMADFRMASSRVGPAGGIRLAQALSAGAPAPRVHRWPRLCIAGLPSSCASLACVHSALAEAPYLCIHACLLTPLADCPRRQRAGQARPV